MARMALQPPLKRTHLMTVQACRCPTPSILLCSRPGCRVVFTRMDNGQLGPRFRRSPLHLLGQLPFSVKALRPSVTLIKRTVNETEETGIGKGFVSLHFSFLAALWHMEFLGRRWAPSHSCDLHTPQLQQCWIHNLLYWAGDPACVLALQKSC